MRDEGGKKEERGGARRGQEDERTRGREATGVERGREATGVERRET